MTDWLTEPVPGEGDHVPAPQPMLLDIANPGVIYDGSFGYEYNGFRTIDLAGTLNWPGLTREDEAVLHRIQCDLYDYATEEGREVHACDAVVFIELVEEATAFLDEHCCPEGWRVEWVDGDLMLWTDEESCAASGDTCQDAGHVHTAQ